LEGWSCATAKEVPALESRKQRMRENKLDSIKIVPLAQDGKQAPFSPKQRSQNGKPHQKLGMYCVSKSCSFTQQPRWLPGTSPIWRALTGELRSPRSQQHMHGSLRGTAVCWPSLPLECYASWQCWPL